MDLKTLLTTDDDYYEAVRSNISPELLAEMDAQNDRFEPEGGEKL